MPPGAATGRPRKAAGVRCAAGPRVGLPLVGRQADQWNCSFRSDDDWAMRLGIVRESAVAAGRDPAEIEVGTTIERPLPTTDAESEELLHRLSHLHERDITHFTMDFGHPPTAEHVHRFKEQVMDVMRA